MNLVLLLFNLVPAFPLDGGRIARAIAWKLTGDRHRATRFAARIGIGFGWLLIGLRLLLALVGAAPTSTGSGSRRSAGCSASAARSTLAQTAFTEQLAGITVADIMDAEPVTIPAALPVARAYEDYFLRYQGWDWFAVVEDDGRFVGPRPPRRRRARGARRRAARAGARRRRAAAPTTAQVAGRRAARGPAGAPSRCAGSAR